MDFEHDTNTNTSTLLVFEEIIQFNVRKILTCALKTQDKDLKVKLKNECWCQT